MKKWMGLIALLSVSLAGCAPTPEPDMEASKGADPVMVDASHYKADFENDRVRVLRISYGPGEKSVMHYHPAGVSVFLTDLKGKFTFPDDTSQDLEGTAGQALWIDAGQHLPENTSEEAFEVIHLELKDAPAAMEAGTGETGPDPAEVDPDHYKVEFENDRVRIVRIQYGPGEKSVMHYHPDGVAIFLADGNNRFTFPDGNTQEMEVKARDVSWVPGGQHLPENAGAEPIELVLVELKK